MTVSKVLRDAPDISAATKARVRILAQEMGYVPDSLAQGLRTRTTRTFGLVIPAATHPFFARAILAIEEHAHDAGYEVILCHHLNETAREENVIRRLLSRRIDGLIIAPAPRLSQTAPIYEELQASGTATVILGQRAPFCASFASIETEDLLGSMAATQHLLSLGHRRIAFFAGPSAAPWAQERMEGFKRALRDAGLEPDESLIFNAGGTIEEGEKTALQMLNEGVRATAIQASNDMAAVGAATVFMKQGVRIPRDLSIIGFGDVLLSEYFAVPLSTVRQPKYRIGAGAVEMIRKLLKREPVESRRLPTDLLVRASTGPASGP